MLDIIKDLKERLESFGFVVYVAKSGTYGVYTDLEGKTLTSFQYDRLEGLTYSGNYKGIGCNIGSGWRHENKCNYRLLNKATYESMLYSSAPEWATGGGKYYLKSLKEYMNFYGNQYNLTIDSKNQSDKIPENQALTGTQNQIK